ncbi:MAG: ABC transporter ATP-binding protein [Opitutales bacterium]
MNETGTSPVVEGHDLWKSYDAGRVPVLHGVSLSVNAGEMVALWGASGSGKSTLLHLIGGLDRPDRGTLRVAGLEPGNPDDRLQLRRHHTGFVFQLHNLIADLTLRENLLVPAWAVGLAAREADRRLAELAGQLGLGHRLGHRIQDLSGGERQRAAIGRALMNRPQILLADEPTGSLDEATGEETFALLKSLTRSQGVAIVLATHERRFAEACDRWLHLRQGRIIEP